MSPRPEEGYNCLVEDHDSSSIVWPTASNNGDVSSSFSCNNTLTTTSSVTTTHSSITTTTVSPLIVATRRGHVKELRSLIQQQKQKDDPAQTFHAWLHQTDGRGLSALYWAICGKHVECLDLLLQQQCDFKQNFLSKYNRHGIRPLELAVAGKDVSIVQLLLDYGADPTLASHNTGTSAFWQAVSQDSVAAVQCILDHQQQQSNNNSDMLTAVDNCRETCLFRVQSAGMVHLLLQYYTTLSAASTTTSCSSSSWLQHTNRVGTTALLHAIEQGLYSAAIALAQYDGETVLRMPNIVDETPWTQALQLLSSLDETTQNKSSSSDTATTTGNADRDQEELAQLNVVYELLLVSPPILQETAPQLLLLS